MANQKHMVIFKNLHNQMIVQMPVDGPSILWIISNFTPVLKQLFIQYPPLVALFENGDVCGIEVQLL